jgi:hypothetical protein
MSGNNDKTMMIGLLLVGAYLMMQKRAVAGQPGYVPPGAVATMPGSAGTGWAQVGASALFGFLKGVQQSPTSYGPSSLVNGQQYQTDYAQSGTVQDIATPFGDGWPSMPDDASAAMYA